MASPESSASDHSSPSTSNMEDHVLTYQNVFNFQPGEARIKGEYDYVASLDEGNYYENQAGGGMYISPTILKAQLPTPTPSDFLRSNVTSPFGSFSAPPSHPSQSGNNSPTALSTPLSTSNESSTNGAIKKEVDVGYGNVKGLPLLVTGVPLEGAKSRVETQIKVRIALVLPLDPSSANSEVKSEEEKYAFINTYGTIRLQKGTATKRKSRKAAALAAAALGENPQEVDVEKTLYLETEVYCATEGASEGSSSASGEEGVKKGLRVYACSGCRAREVKRSSRKLAQRVRPTESDSDLDTPFPNQSSTHDERHKIVLFNCSSTIDFSHGECFLPARVTCYCRHHREKVGFLLKFILKDCRGNLVASGITPPVMITDDHKSARGSTSGPPSVSKQVTSPSHQVEPKPSRLLNAPATKSRRIATKKPRDSSNSGEEEGRRRSAPKPYDRKSPAATSGSSARPMAAMSVSSKADTSSTTSTLSPPAPPPTALANNGLVGEMVQIAEKNREKRQGKTISETNGMMLEGMGGSSSVATSSSEAPATSWMETPSSHHLSQIPSHSQHSTDEEMDHNLDMDSILNYNGTADLEDEMVQQNYYPEMTFETLLSPQQLDVPSGIPSALPSPTLHRHQTTAEIAEELHWPSVPPSTSYFPPTQQQQAPPSPPMITRLIPGQGPMHGGIEVTILGANFIHGLTCMFGDSQAETSFWSENTMVCILPPSPSPGPVVVSVKGTEWTGGNNRGAGLQLFTYLDNSDRQLMELALQVVGMKMTGRIEDAKNVALRIVGPSPGFDQHGYTQHDLSADQGRAAYHNQMSTSQLASDSETSQDAGSSTIDTLPWGSSNSRDFQSTIMEFLNLVDLDVTDVPGASSSTPISAVVSHQNPQGHTLLHLAVMMGFHRLVAQLLAAGIDVDVRDRNGYTALALAALCGRVTCARLLLDAGASPEIVTATGRLPIEIAGDRDQIDVEHLLSRQPGALAYHQEIQLDSAVSLSVSDDSIDHDNPSSDGDFNDEPPKYEVGSVDISLPPDHVEVTSEEELPEPSVINKKQQGFVDTWMRRIHLPPPKFQFPNLPVPHFADLPPLAFPVHFPFPVNFSQNPWSTPSDDEKAGTVGRDAQQQPPTWAQYIQAYPWLPFAIAQWWQQMANGMPLPLGTGATGQEQQQQRKQATAESSHLLQPSTTSTSPSISSVNAEAGPSKRSSTGKQNVTKASFRRQLGYEPNQELTDREISKYGHHQARRRRMKHDRMLWLFWIPVLVFMIGYTLFSRVATWQTLGGIRRIAKSILPFGGVLPAQ